MDRVVQCAAAVAGPIIICKSFCNCTGGTQPSLIYSSSTSGHSLSFNAGIIKLWSYSNCRCCQTKNFQLGILVSLQITSRTKLNPRSCYCYHTPTLCSSSGLCVGNVNHRVATLHCSGLLLLLLLSCHSQFIQQPSMSQCCHRRRTVEFSSARSPVSLICSSFSNFLRHHHQYVCRTIICLSKLC